MEYKILSGSDERTLSAQVSEHLNNGWQLRGDIFVTPFSHEDVDQHDYCIFTQVLMREDKPSETDSALPDELHKA